jgi:hypothetical protein
VGRSHHLLVFVPDEKEPANPLVDEEVAELVRGESRQIGHGIGHDSIVHATTPGCAGVARLSAVAEPESATRKELSWIDATP